MSAQTHVLSLPNGILQDGFWLYVWRVLDKNGAEYLYVGRTGDSSSPYARSPYQRMGQHLGRQQNTNALRKHLGKVSVVPEECKEIDMIAHGPIFPDYVRPDGFDYSDSDAKEQVKKTMETERKAIAALEKQLAVDLKAAGYRVMNTVPSKQMLPADIWKDVHLAFSKHFPKLEAVS